MTMDRSQAIEALLIEAQAAHHVYESTELAGVYDEDWPRWYASFLLDRGIAALLPAPIEGEELAAVLAAPTDGGSSDATAAAEPWSRSTARRLVTG